MLMLEALQEFPKGKKGYLFYGDPHAMHVLRKTYFPNAVYADSPGAIASADPIPVIITYESYDPEVLDYLALPKSDKTYILMFDSTEGKGAVRLLYVQKKLSTLKLPRIDCTDPSTPKAKQVAVSFLCTYLRVSEATAWQIGQRAEWKLATLLNVVYAWTRLTTEKLSESQVTNLIDTLLPRDVVETFIGDVIERKFHKLNIGAITEVDIDPLFRGLSEVLDKMRILKAVMPETSTSTLITKTGLTAPELKKYVPLVKSIKSSELARWGDSLQWAYLRRDKPGIVRTLVSLMAGD